MRDPEPSETDPTSDFEDEDTLEYAFTDDDTEDFEEATWEWDGESWKQVA